jgi:hypothetical protein
VPVVVKHGASVILTGASQVAVAEFEGKCGGDIADRITSALTSSGDLQVVDRRHVKTLLGELNFGRDGLLNPTTIARVGRILGATALVVGNCDSDIQQESFLRRGFLDKKDHRVILVRASASASIHIVDLATLKTYAAGVYEGKDERQYDVMPDQAVVLNKAYEDIVEAFIRVVAPWTETIELAVYDDEQGNLKAGAVSIRLGAFGEAEELFRATIEAHATGGAGATKMLSKAYHNLGVVLIGAGRFREAEGALERSLSLRPTGDVKDVLAHARRLADLKGRVPTVVVAGQTAEERTPKACRFCKAALRPGATFCSNCGKAVAAPAALCANPKCGKPLPKGARFCDHCGTPVPQDPR